MNRCFLLRVFAVLLIVCSLAACVVGPTPWSEVWSDALKILSGQSQGWNPLLHERLPRLIVLLCTGASLAVAGAVMQSLFQNPLAAPSVLGITSGGSLLVVLVFAMQWHLSYPYLIPLSAFVGCLATLLIVYNLSRRRGCIHMTNLILTGIATSTLLIAVEQVILYAMRHQWVFIQTVTEWTAGSTADRHWNHVHLQVPITLVGIAICWFYRQEINILTLGDDEARSLGVDIERVRWRLFLATSLLCGGALAAVGIIAFFGLVLPHVIRSLQGPNNLHLIPACTLGGGVFLLALDLTLRFFSIHLFSIGNISAILGGAFFIILLLKQRQQIYATN